MERSNATSPRRTASLADLMPVSRPGKPLDAVEVRRRCWHLVPGLLPFLLWGIPHRDPWGWPLITVVTLLIGTVSAVMIANLRSISRPNSDDGIDTILGYSLPILFGVWWFTGKEEIALMAVGILSFGDGMATLGGKRLGGWVLPWNPEKTITGWFCFLLAGTVMGGLICWGETRPGIDLGSAIRQAGLATLVTSFVESIPVKGNDNLRVSLTALLACALIHGEV